jgi:hypothetical protein
MSKIEKYRQVVNKYNQSLVERMVYEEEPWLLEYGAWWIYVYMEMVDEMGPYQVLTPDKVRLKFQEVGMANRRKEIGDSMKKNGRFGLINLVLDEEIRYMYRQFGEEGGIEWEKKVGLIHQIERGIDQGIIQHMRSAMRYYILNEIRKKT